MLAHLAPSIALKLIGDDGDTLEFGTVDTTTGNAYVRTSNVYVSGGDATNHLDRLVNYVSTASVAAFFSTSLQ